MKEVFIFGGVAMCVFLPPLAPIGMIIIVIGINIGNK